MDPTVGVLESDLMSHGMRGLRTFLRDDLQPVELGAPGRVFLNSPINAAAIKVRKPHNRTRVTCMQHIFTADL